MNFGVMVLMREIYLLLSILFFSFSSSSNNINKVEKIKEYSSNPNYLPILTNKAFKRGEELTYKLHYGFLDAAYVYLNITNEKIKFKVEKHFM